VQRWAGLVAGEDLSPKDWMKEIHQILIPFPVITNFMIINDHSFQSHDNKLVKYNFYKDIAQTNKIKLETYI
jgi:hypothetical protein